MEVKIFQFNPIGVNTYVVYDETKECAIIDAGSFYHDEKELLLNFILDNELKVKHLLNTHLHFDHILGNEFVKEQFGLDAEANALDQFLLDELPAQMQMFGFEPVKTTPVIGRNLREGDVVTFGNQRFEVLQVPGHSPGSIVFYSRENKCVFAGDVLFRYSIGRTDLAGGDYNQLIEGIRHKLMVLPSDTVVYPGHGPATTIGDEMRGNPFL